MTLTKKSKRSRSTALTAALIAVTLSYEAHAADSPVRVLHYRMDTVVNEDGTSVQDIQIMGKVSNDSAARTEAQQTAPPFSEDIEVVTLVEAYTEKPDGTRLAVKPDAIRTQLAPGIPTAPAYSNRKTIVAILPNLAGGDTFFTHWRRTITHPILPGAYAQTELFVRTIPWDQVDVSISTPADKPMQTEAHGGTLETTEQDGRHLYRWQFSAPAVVDGDPTVLSPLDRLPRLFASTFPNWAAFSRIYAALFAPKTEVIPQIQTLAEQVTAGIDDRREQARQLYNWVSGHVRWVAIYLGNGAFEPHAASDVLANGYGDCKDQVALLVALLRAKGIASEPVLINLGPSYMLSGPATYTAFNHVIIYVPEWQIYADTVPGQAPFGTLPITEYGKPVLHIMQGGDEVRRMTTLAPGDATEHLRTRAKLDTDGVISGTSTTTATGPFLIALHAIKRAIQASGPERFASDLLGKLGEPGSGVFADFAVDAAAPSGENIQGTFSLNARPGVLEGDDLRLPTGLRVLLRTGDGPIGLLANRTLPISEDTPCYSAHQEEELSLELPDGYQPVQLPKDLLLSKSFFHYESKWSLTDQTILVKRSFVSTLDRPLCIGESRAEAAKALVAIRRDINSQIRLKRAE